MVLADQKGSKPAGSPVTVKIPVAPVVVWVISFKMVLTISFGEEEAALAVLAGITVIVPVALMSPQLPVRGIE